MTTKAGLPRELHISPDWRPSSAVMECPYWGCTYKRSFGTLAGHRMGLGNHMRLAHGVRVYFDFRLTSLSEYREQVRRVLELA